MHLQCTGYSRANDELVIQKQKITELWLKIWESNFYYIMLLAESVIKVPTKAAACINLTILDKETHFSLEFSLRNTSGAIHSGYQIKTTKK